MATENSQDRQKYIVLIVVGLLYSIGVAYLFANVPGHQDTDDFYPRWYASKMLLTTGRSLYDWANSVEVARGWPFVHQIGYYYPAYLLLFTAPLAMLPFMAARIIWTVFGLWCLWLGMFILDRLLQPAPSVNRLTLLLILVTTSVPVMQHTLNAQFNALGVFALALTYGALYRQKYFLAGVWASGMLFKPQATLIPLFCLLIWTGLKSERRYFWGGLGLMSIAFWLLAEWLEPNWVTAFLHALGRYERTHSVADTFGNPYQIVSLSGLVATTWLTFHFRYTPVGAPGFLGLMAWAISLNSLIVPLFGMLHMVLTGVLFVILLSGFSRKYPQLTPWLWRGIIALFLAGLVAFIGPLVVEGASGLQITSAEVVYKILMPVLAAVAALGLMFNSAKEQKVFNEIIDHNSRI